MRVGARLLAVLLLGLLLAVSGCGTQVPDLRGKTPKQAEDVLAEAGFKLGRVDYDEKAQSAQGAVVGQEPADGARAARGSIVSIVVAGSPPVKVPDLSNLRKNEAAAALTAVGLGLGQVVESYDTSTPAGIVTSQTPPAGEEAPGRSTVSLTISKGPRPVTVPSMVKKSVDDARKELAAAGLKVEAIEKDDAAEKGTVLSQAPGAGSQVQRGSTVRLTLSTGVELVRVPNIHGMMDPDPLLRRRGLKPVGIPIRGPIESDAAGIGEAYRQRPRAGALVPKGTKVTYHYWWESG